MVQVQIIINVPGQNNNTVSVNILEREDATAPEREMAYNIQDMLLGVMEMVRDELPPGEVVITEIGNPSDDEERRGWMNMSNGEEIP